jgi:serine/threonine protein phosphatase PrpC
MTSCIRCGFASNMGGRPYMEDKASCFDYGNNKFFFGVFDGHGGNKVSSYLSQFFPIVLKNQQKFDVDLLSSLQQAWIEIENNCKIELQKIAVTNKLNNLPPDGSTAVVVLIDNNNIYITNCGDSSCYSITRKGIFTICTEDHGTLNSDEIQRIKTGI